LENTITPDGTSYFEYFRDQDWANECVFSYPGESWVSIYKKDASGNIYWTKDSSGNVKAQKFYFQIQVVDSQPEIVNYTTKTPPELEFKNECAIIDGKCKDSPGTTKVKVTKQVVIPIAPVLPKNLPQIPKNIQKNKISREEFEKMGSKEAIINWMIENMNPVDILACLQQNDPGYSGYSEQTNITELANEMDDLQIESVIKDVSFEDLVSQIMEIPDLKTRYDRILEICTKSGEIDEQDIEVIETKKGGIKIMVNDEVLSESKIASLLQGCAKKEAKRLTKLIKK